MPEADLQRTLKKALPLFQAHLHADDDELIAALVSAGIEKELATRIVLFTPLAFTRVFFERSKVQFAETYYHMKADGSLGPECRLEAEPVFQAALALARNREIAGPAMLPVTDRSGAFKAISQAMKQGSQLENLAVSPAILMGTEEPPGEEPPKEDPPKPWWRFWK